MYIRIYLFKKAQLSLWWSWRYTSTHLTSKLDAGELSASRYGRLTLASLEQQDGWTPEPVRTLLWRGKRYHCQESNTHPPAVQPTPFLTLTASWLYTYIIKVVSSLQILRPNFFSISIIAIRVLNARYTYLILFDETQRNVCKNLRTECALAREFRDAGTLLLFLLDFLCVASVFQDPAYKWNLSYRSPR